jgi:benzoate membrane transport protein
MNPFSNRLPMRQASLFQPAGAGLIASFVGFASSFAVILKGLTAVGATDAQAGCGLMALSIAMGLAGIALSLWSRMPISAAWSTPGAALLATTGLTPGGFPAAVGAFLIVGVLLVAAGLIRPFGRAVAAIPPTLANAMLAGVLFSLCLAPVKAMAEVPRLAAPIILVWVLMARWKRLYATPAAAIVAGLLIAATSHGAPIGIADLAPHPIVVTPTFSISAFVSLAMPLFIVTMASQNLPGLAVLSTYGYRPSPGPLIATTGFFTILAAPFGGLIINLSAITAALCAAPDAHPDPTKRWIAAAAAGCGYIVLGLLAGAMTSFVAGSPLLIEAVAGLALLGAFGASLNNALIHTQEREAALVTFLTAASGLSFLGVGGAFWGLIAGGAILALTRAGAVRAKPTTP